MSVPDWIRFVVWFAGELLVVVVGAAILHFCFRSSHTRRSLWQAAFTAIGLVVIVELSDVREKSLWSNLRPYHHFAITVNESSLPKERMVESDVPATKVPDAPERTPVALKWPAWLWFAGAVLLLVRSFAARIWLGFLWRSATTADAESLNLIADLQTQLRLRHIRVQIWTRLRSPVAFGIFLPTIALPPDFSEHFSIGERQAMLTWLGAILSGS